LLGNDDGCKDGVPLKLGLALGTDEGILDTEGNIEGIEVGLNVLVGPMLG